MNATGSFTRSIRRGLPNARRQRPKLLLFQPPYDWEPLRPLLEGRYDIIEVDWRLPGRDMPLTESAQRWIKPLAGCEIPPGTFSEIGEPLSHFIIRQIADDWNRNAGYYRAALRLFAESLNECSPSAALWGNSPVGGPRGLYTDYLMHAGIPVIGFQHGGLLGNQHQVDPELTDLSRCSHYVTYGFTSDDVALVVPRLSASPSIMPLGCTASAQKKPVRKRIDILFPITMTVSMFSGFKGENPDGLLRKQVAILGHLKSLSDRTVMIKPFPGATHENLAVAPLLEDAGHMLCAWNRWFDDVLAEFEVKCVIIEHVSTPIYRCLPHDTDIFMVAPPMAVPIEASALELLKRRVYYFEDVDELLRNLDLFLEGKLPKKRDDSFYNRYVWKPNARENIMALVDRVVSGQPS